MHILTVENLNKYYGKYHVLNDISFQINSGDIVGLVGPNGIGKSTLMRTMLNLEKKRSGTVKILDDIDHRSETFFEHLSFVPSENHLYDHLTGRDHFIFVANVHNLDKKRIQTIIELTNIERYVDTKIKTYSFGMRQRLLIALSLLIEPKIILMDEPFNGLDPTSVIEIRELILDLQEEGMSFLISTHNLDVLEHLTDKIWFIKDGKLVDTDKSGEVETVIEVKEENRSKLQELKDQLQIIDGKVVVTNQGINDVLGILINANIEVTELYEKKLSLENVYTNLYELEVKER